MAFLKESKIDGDLLVEGSIKSQYISSSLLEESDVDKKINFPRIIESAVVNSIGKFADNKSSLKNSSLTETISEATSINQYNIPLKNINFNNVKASETFDEKKYNLSVSNISAQSTSIVFCCLVDQSSLQVGDMYIIEDDKCYTTKKSIGSYTGKFFYENQLISFS